METEGSSDGSDGTTAGVRFQIILGSSKLASYSFIILLFFLDSFIILLGDQELQLKS